MSDTKSFFDKMIYKLKSSSGPVPVAPGCFECGAEGSCRALPVDTVEYVFAPFPPRTTQETGVRMLEEAR
jgi:hypothetical protein